MSDKENTLNTLLNKEEFVQKSLDNDVDAKTIQAEWSKIEQMFTLLFLQLAHNSLSESDKAGVTIQLSQEPTKEDLIKFTTKMSEFLNKKPDAIDNQEVTKLAAEETLKQYKIYSEGEK
jgi:hypothetical protein